MNYFKLLEKLKQATIINHFNEINDVSADSLDLYDVMLFNLFNGELDDVFVSENLDESNKDEVMELARKYKSLCFYQGDETLWTDSIDGVTLLDPDLICVKLLNNYNFLIAIAKDFGEDALKFLLKFNGGTLAAQSSVIDSLRNRYGNDELLKSIISEMSKKDSAYRDFSEDERVILCTYPEGLLYEEENKNIKMISSEDTKKSIKKLIVGDDVDEPLNAILKGVSIEEFTEIVTNIHSDYQSGYYEL